MKPNHTYLKSQDTKPHLTYLRQEPDIEALSEQVVALAADFARTCKTEGPIPDHIPRGQFDKMIARLTSGSVLDRRDDHCLAEIGVLLIAGIEERVPGWSQYYLEQTDRSGHYFLCEVLEYRYHRLKQWQRFDQLRAELRTHTDRMAMTA